MGAIAYYSTVVGAGTEQVRFVACMSQFWETYVSQATLDCAVSGQCFEPSGVRASLIWGREISMR